MPPQNIGLEHIHYMVALDMRHYMVCSTDVNNIAASAATVIAINHPSIQWYLILQFVKSLR